MRNHVIRMVLVLLFLSPCAHAAKGRRAGVYLLPMTCAELLPDISPFIHFFEAVGRGNVQNDRVFARRIFRVLALREKIVEAADRAREQNPVDVLVRKTLCFYREQREPLKAVTYEDPAFVEFLRGALKELEDHVDDAIFQWQFDRAQRHEYERQLERNQRVVDTVKEQADVEADRTFEKIATLAKKKAEQ